MDPQKSNTDSAGKKSSITFTGVPPSGGGSSNGAYKPPSRRAPAGGPSVPTFTPPPPPIGTLRHMSFSCPGFSSNDAKLDISSEPLKFFFPPSPEEIEEIPSYKSLSLTKQSLTTAYSDRLIIPLFQRTYCWTEEQGVKWWADTRVKYEEMFPKLRAGDIASIQLHRHAVGKIVIRSYDESNLEDAADATEEKPALQGWMVIDGQQRLTTTSIHITTLRDTLLQRLRLLEKKQKQGIPANLEDAVTAAIEHAKKRLYFMATRLFVDPQSADDYAEKVLLPRELKRRQQGTTTTTTTTTTQNPVWALCDDGAAPPFLRLIPSFNDRSPFLEILMVGLIQDQLRRRRDEADGESMDSQLHPPLSPVAEHSFQGRMKRTLDAEAGKWMASIATKTASQEPAGEEEERKAIRILIAQITALCDFSDLLVEGIGAVVVQARSANLNIAQAFLWLQEKSLFSLGALLYNPAPGINFRASDLVRNLLLAPSMSLPSIAEQEEIHLDKWVHRVERPLVGIVRRRNVAMAAGTTCAGKVIEEEEGKIGLHIDRVMAALTAKLLEEIQQQEKPSDRCDEEADSAAATTAIEEERDSSFKREQPSATKKNKPNRHVSEFEDKVRQMSATLKEKDFTNLNTSGMVVYAEFYSAFEHYLKNALIQKAIDAGLADATAPVVVGGSVGVIRGRGNQHDNLLRRLPHEDVLNVEGIVCDKVLTVLADEVDAYCKQQD